MRKRLLQTFFLCLPLAVLLTVGAGAAVASGTWGDNIKWTLNDDGVLTFAGTGKMADAEARVGAILPEWSHNEKVRSVKIENGITSIGANVFRGCDFAEITIPSSVTEIGEGAFSGCSVLTEITIPGTVETIGDFAFAHCSTLKKATILEGVKTIGYEILQFCDNLTEVSIPSSVTSIDSGLGTKAIKIATFPASTFDSNNSPPVFQSRESLEEVTIIGNADAIPESAFSHYYKNLKKVTILDGVKTIEHSAFSIKLFFAEVFQRGRSVRFSPERPVFSRFSGGSRREWYSSPSGHPRTNRRHCR